jgi:hypothetical protein
MVMSGKGAESSTLKEKLLKFCSKYPTSIWPDIVCLSLTHYFSGIGMTSTFKVMRVKAINTFYLLQLL